MYPIDCISISSAWTVAILFVPIQPCRYRSSCFEYDCPNNAGMPARSHSWRMASCNTVLCWSFVWSLIRSLGRPIIIPCWCFRKLYRTRSPPNFKECVNWCIIKYFNDHILLLCLSLYNTVTLSKTKLELFACWYTMKVATMPLLWLMLRTSRWILTQWNHFMEEYGLVSYVSMNM